MEAQIENPVMNDLFDQVVDPVGREEFLEKYFEKQYLHLKRDDDKYYENILTAAEISQFLDRQDIFYPSLRIVKNGKEIPHSGYTLKGSPIGHHRKDGIINTEQAFNLFNSGSTLVIQAGQRYFQNLSFFCHELSQVFSAPVQANLYITPQKSVGFNPHWDTHDVMVLQITGTKTWHLYGFGKELPVKSQGSSGQKFDQEPEQTFQLSPGDLLYLPRGYVHDAVADDGISAHITIGILAYTWLTLIQNVMGQVAEQKTFREAIPFWSADLASRSDEKIELLANALNNLDWESALKKLKKNFTTIQPMPVKNYFQSLVNISALTENTRIALNKGLFISEHMDGEKYVLNVPGKKIALPLSAMEIWNFIKDHHSFAMAELPGNWSTESKKALVQKLVQEGILFIDD